VEIREERKTSPPARRAPDGADAQDPADVAIWLPVVRGKSSVDELRIRISPATGDFEEWAILGTDVEGFDEAYPDLNIQGELMKVAAWLKSNKPKRKTPSGMTRFLNGWMDRAQNRGGDSARRRGGRRVTVPAANDETNELRRRRAQG
jgi:hypothetical protein